MPAPPAAPTCPGVQTLARCVLGQLPEPEARRVRIHAAGCPKCGAVFAQPATPGPATQPAAIRLVPAAPTAVTRLAVPPAPHTWADAGDAEDDLPPVTDVSFLRPATDPSELGRLGPYRVLAELGSGGMGVVFKATDPNLNRTVALKVLKPEYVRDEKSRQRFLREARAAGAVEHDHVVSVYQVGEDNGVPYIAMPLLKGKSLLDHLEGMGRIPVMDALRIAKEMALGLAAAHEKGLVHRDVKPGNVWLEEPAGRVKILDFGLARAASDDRHLTKTGTVVGTPAYMSPEQASGKPVDARSDLFSLGSVLYHILTGRPPFYAPDDLATLMAVVTEQPTAITEYNPEVPELFVRLVVWLLMKHPDDRPPSAAKVAELCGMMEREFTAALDEAGELPPPPAPAGGVSKLVLAGLAAVVLLAGGYAFRGGDRPGGRDEGGRAVAGHGDSGRTIQ